MARGPIQESIKAKCVVWGSGASRVISLAGNPCSFISPSSSIPSLTLDQFFPSSQQAHDAPNPNSTSDLSCQAPKLNAELETLKRTNKNLTARLEEGTARVLFDADLDKADLTQLLAMKKDLQRILEDLRLSARGVRC